MTEQTEGQVTWSDLGLWSGKMCPELSAATKEKTSRQSSKRSSASQSRKPPILKCLKRDGQLGVATTMRWEDDGAWLGECMTRNTGESPNAAVVSRLSQILEVTPQEKYSLSAKACQGILRRAERRGKDLPEMLKTVLLMQSESGGGCDGGGKGALVQEDKSGTLGTGNDQTIFCLQGNGIDCADTAGCNGKGWREDTSYTLNTIDRPAVCAGVAYISGVDGYNGDLTGDVASTIGVNCGMSTGRNGVMELSANENGGMERDSVLCGGNKPAVVAPAVLCLNDQGGNVMGVSHDVSSTLRAQEHGHQPSILDMSHACDVIRDCGEIVPSLQARMGTGGNQVPLITYGIGNGQANEASIMAEEVSQALNTMHDAQAILYQPKSAMEENWAESETKNALRAGESKVSHVVVCEDVSPALRAKANDPYREDMAAYIASVDCRNFREGGETNGTLQAKSNGGTSYNLQNTVRTGMIVRRFTPMECERLQGFPDGWTDIGEWRDSKGKMRKPSDSPRYKALGNSIALPFWDFLAKRISAQYLRPVTMGSLFDGIGGFPLVFERHNGKGTARWASEIEEFPIAVTKKWFGEE